MSPDGPSKKFPPEERLLRLIRGKGAVPAPGQGGAEQPAAGGESAVASGGQASTPSGSSPGSAGTRTSTSEPSGKVGGWKFGRKAAGGAERTGRGTGRSITLPPWWLKAVNIVLGTLVAGELIALLVLWMRPIPSLEAMTEETEHDSSGRHVGRGIDERPMPSLASAARRPLFKTLTRGPAAPRAGGPSAEAKALAQRLSLIGVVGGDPVQVIIEDSQQKKTFFVSVGQSLIEGLVVEDVKDNRVILDLNGEKIELSL